MRVARSNNGRIEWAIIDGRLKETGPESPTFTMSAQDTLTLTILLMTEYKAIVKAAQQEHSLATGELDKYDVMQQKWATRKQYNDSLQEGVEGVEYNRAIELNDIAPIDAEGVEYNQVFELEDAELLDAT